jgi:hypothetical protein
MENSTQIQKFLDRWHASGAAERANYQLFLSELCDIIEVEHPNPASENPHENAYVFEKSIPSTTGTTNFIDLYKRGHFVLEAKQGSDKVGQIQVAFSEAELVRRRSRKKGTAVRGTKAWDTAMEKARQQAQTYSRGLPHDEIIEGRPPFILVVDVGNTIALFSEFSRTGGDYTPFPDPASYRIKLDDLLEVKTRQLLHQIWEAPTDLDPSRRSAKITRDIATRLAILAKSLEGNYKAETVAQFLMRCLFTMFAEDVGLLPANSFTQLLEDIRNNPSSFKPMLEHLWDTMNKGGFSVILRQQIPRFNGGLFADQTALPLTLTQIELLAEAAKADWRDVEPAIFGTLLERALDPMERHKLGAHYTPRAYVERLVKPTIIDPLRAEWEGVQAAALLYAESELMDKAIAEVETFHRRLVTIRVLDPACGSGNFLYVTLEHLKRLEGEVLNTMQEMGSGQMKMEMVGVTVSPQQFLGIEVNPRAAAIAELVLWIGHLQWHYRTLGNTPFAEPIIKDYHNIECRDAVLAWDAVEPLINEHGEPVSHWDGHSKKSHPVTGYEVPDETARIPAYDYINPRAAEWPKADFIVGNPPFIGTKLMRDALGDGYTQVLRRTYKDLPESIDYVMYWWHKSANLVRKGKAERFGLITTNSLRQTFNRHVLQLSLEAKEPLALMFAIPDHPWVDSIAGAAVRISMTVGKKGNEDGLLQEVISERNDGTESFQVHFIKQKGRILPDLTIGVNLSKVRPLVSNQNLSSRGVQLIGSGFKVTPDQGKQLGLGTINGAENHIRLYRNGRDVTSTARNMMVLDLFGLPIEEVQMRYPEIYQWVLERVKPERDQNNRKNYRENWWIFGEPRSNFRPALIDLEKFIVTPATSKHRFFTFLDKRVLPDDALINFAFDDGYFLGVLSSTCHVNWVLANGSILGPTPRYINSKCFENFPFPDATDAQKVCISELAEQLDSHRNRQQATHPGLTLTDMYNVLVKVSAGEPLNAKDQTTHQQGLISILNQLHNDINEAVLEAYGWATSLNDEEILQHLVDLNTERAAEEDNGHFRWLRPGYQISGKSQPQQSNFDLPPAPDIQVASTEKQNWPSTLRDRATAIRAACLAFDRPVGADDLASSFIGRLTKKRIGETVEIVEMLVALGQVRKDNGKYIIG